MESYGLTPLGKRIARRTGNPDELPFRVIHFLDKYRSADKNAISVYVGMSPIQTAVVLRALKAKNIVAEESEANV